MLKRFSLDVRAVSAKKKVTKEILTTQECFERIEEKASNSFAAQLIPREKNRISKRPFVSVENKMAPVSSNFCETGHHFSRECLRI